MSSALKADPKEYFHYPACAACLGRPCNDMRFGAFYQGDFLLAHNRNYSTLDPCPFAAGSFDEVESLLQTQSLRLLDQHIQALITQFTPSEAIRFNQNSYIDGGNDLPGRIEYLHRLWDERIFSLLRIPPVLDQDEKIKTWINVWNRVFFEHPEEKKEDAEAGPEQAAAATPGLANPRWEHADEKKKQKEPDHAATSDKIFLKADVSGLAENAAITFDIFANSSGNEHKIATISGQNAQGMAKVQWTVDLSKATDAKDLTFEASAQEIKSERGKIQLAADEDMIFLAPGHGENHEGEYFIVPASEIDALKVNIDHMDKLRAEINDMRTTLSSSGSTPENLKKAEETREKVEAELEGITIEPSDAIQELILVKSNVKWGKISKRRVYIAPHSKKSGAVKGHWRKLDDVTVKDKIHKWLKNEPDLVKENFTATMKGVLWESEKIDTQWPIKWKCLKDRQAKGEADTAAGYFSGSAEAQFLRFVAGASVDTELDLKKMELSLVASGNISYDLASGKVSGSWSLPGKNGIDLFNLLRLNEKGRNAIKDGRECLMRLTLEAAAKAFVGASITGSIALPAIDLSRKDKDASWSDQQRKSKQRFAYAEAGADGFAGATAEGSIAAKAEWSPETATEFKSLAFIEALVSGSAGIGGTARVTFGYQEGKLKFQCVAAAVVGLGGKAGFAFEIGIDEGFELLAHIFYSVNYHYVEDVLGSAFKAFRDYAFLGFTTEGEIGKDIFLVSLHKFENMGAWLHNITSSKQLPEAKNIIKTNINDPQKLKNAPPETLGGQVLRTIMATVEESDFDAIIKVLESARTDHELKWIMRCIVDYVREDTDGSLLREGIKRVLYYGEPEKSKEELKNYKEKIKNILDMKGIDYAGI